MRSPVSRHRVWQLAVDALLVAGAWYLAFKLRFDPRLPVFYERYLDGEVIALVVGLKLAVFTGFGFYHRSWRYVSTRDMWGVAYGVTAASLLVFLAFQFFPVHRVDVPRSVWVLDWLLALALLAAVRLAARTLIERPGRGLVARGREVIVVGAGDAGAQIVQEMQRSRTLDATPIGFVDDDPRKRNMRIHGVRVIGTVDDLRGLIRSNRPDEVLIAVPSASGAMRQKVVEIARSEGVSVTTLPGLSELISGEVHVSQLRPVEVEDVLGREPVEVDFASISSYLAGETVLVTGAGGSIGSELCRQIERARPGRIVLVDQAESALFEIERELVQERGFTASFPVLADVKNEQRMSKVFAKYAPTVVFHAAAYKHVPVMEANPVESVRNNVLGTRVVANVAAAHGVRRFVLVSTDKALNPHSVYGQTKTLCEWIVAAHSAEAEATDFVAVRFGNVLNSAGSVIPIFRRQIERGGPVTVTDPDMTRFFMTIPEAAALVMQAGAIGGKGRIYVLDMGEPIRILDLARNMIRLSGKEPDRDVEIRFIGARPGEKLHEELFAPGETWSPTSHPKILGLEVEPIDGAWLESELDGLARLVEEDDTLELVSRLSAVTGAPKRVAEAGAADQATPARDRV